MKLFVFDSRASKVDAKMAILTPAWCFSFGRPTDVTVVVRAAAATSNGVAIFFGNS